MPAFANLDQLRLNFDPTGVLVLNLVLAFIMYGVALDIRVQDFKRVVEAPRGPLIGLAAQFILLPAVTFLLTRLMGVPPSIALGMILIAACPGGNVSNVVTHLAKGNVALSVSMTAVSSTAAVVLTPFNIGFWGSLHPDTAALLQVVDLEPGRLFMTVAAILGFPLALGMYTRARWETLALRAREPVRLISVLCLIGFIVAATAANFDSLMTFGAMIFGIVIIHNAVALGTGYAAGRLLRVPVADRRAITFEVGIQNSGLGLGIIFAFFDGLGGMALVAATWGIWHIVAGLSLGSLWSRQTQHLAGAAPEALDGTG